MATILIVDDEPFIRLLLQECLEKFTEKGVEILTTDNGRDALEIIREKKPDLVYLDVMLPKMNGYEVCTMVKKDPSLSEVCIIMLTAKGQDNDRGRGDEVGADIYMTKPFMPDEVVEKASVVLGISVK